MPSATPSNCRSTFRPSRHSLYNITGMNSNLDMSHDTDFPRAIQILGGTLLFVYGFVTNGKSRNMYRIQPNQHEVFLNKNWAMEKCQRICFYKRTPKFYFSR